MSTHTELTNEQLIEAYAQAHTRLNELRSELIARGLISKPTPTIKPLVECVQTHEGIKVIPATRHRKYSETELAGKLKSLTMLIQRELEGKLAAGLE